MKTCIRTIVLALTFMGVCVVHAQSNSVPWSALDGGFAGASTGNTRLTSVVGQMFAGSASIASGGVRSGFLVYPFRSPLSSGIQASGEKDLPTTYDLSQNYPNPFNPLTIIKYTIAGAGGQDPGASNTRLVVYDLLGREVATLVNERKAAGKYEVSFDASGLASGVYVYRLTAGSFVQSRKMI